jgi:hypothetical protein
MIGKGEPWHTKEEEEESLLLFPAILYTRRLKRFVEQSNPACSYSTDRNRTRQFSSDSEPDEKARL